MGNIYEVIATGGSGGQVMIVKYIEPRLGDSNKKDLGDQRKFDSYVVEATFFETYALDFLQHDGICIPTPLKVEREGTKTIICMSRLENATMNNVDDGVIQWLANFHAATWHKDYPGLQPIGSYWHLDTRPDEYNSMPTHGWEGRLKRAARAIDDFLKRDSLQCLIHGDAKDANVMSSNGQVAMCDFQYCGRGSPTVDVAYFLVSSVSPHEQERLVDLYFVTLCKKLSPELRPTRKQFDNNLGLAYCDYARFMSGWGFWGFDIKERVIQILNRLDGGKILSTEKAYDEAIRREFG
jgi:hypothetical protein